MIENWDALLAVFSTDDGSVPEIELDNLSGDEVVRGYGFIRNHADYISSSSPSYWSESKDCEIPFSYEDNPAIQLISGETRVCLLCFGGIKSPSGHVIPNLGLHVFADCLNFTYRMGPQWNQQALVGLFELISCMSADFHRMQITHKDNINDNDGSIFQSYWDAYEQAQQR